MSVFSRRNVDSITRSLSSMVVELASYADGQEGLADQLEKRIEVMKAEVQNHDAEANRARLVADRIAQIVK